MTRLRTLIGISVFWLALSMLGDGFTALVVPEKLAAVVPVGSLATAIGAVTFVGLVAGMLVQPVAGALSDSIAPRFGRTGVLIPAALLVLVALAAFAGLGSLPAIVVSFLLLQVALNIAQAAQQGFIPDRVASGWRGRAAGLKGLADVGGAFLGFALLAALVVGGDIRSAAVALGVVVVGTLVLTLVLVPRRLPPSSSTSRKDRHDGTQLDPERRAAFLRSVGARFLFLLGIYGIGRFLLLFVADRLGVDPTMAGGQTAIVFAGLTLWTAVASLPAGWIADRAGRTTTMCAGAAASAIGSLLLLAAPDVPAMLVFGGLMSIGSAAFVTANWAMTTDVVPAARAGRLLGLANVGTAGAAAVAGLFGPVADVARAAFPGSGYASVFIGAVVPIALSIVVARPLSRLESPRPHSARPPSVREPTLASAQPAGRLLR